MKRINNTRKKEIKRRQALELLKTGMKIKYPKNSNIMFESVSENGEKPKTASCCWYNKVGRPDGKLPNKKMLSIIRLNGKDTLEKAEKIIEMFDENIFLNLKYV